MNRRCKTALNICSALLILLLVMHGRARAHRINILAWQEGDHFTARVYWTDGKPVAEAGLEVTAPDGSVVFRSRTGKDGLCSFRLHKPGKYRLAARASMGHAAETRIDFPANTAIPVHSGNTGQGGPEPLHPVSSQVAAGMASGPVTHGCARHCGEKSGCGCITALQLKAILDSRLRPIMREIALTRAESRKISPENVIAGLGYIAGLAGIALWASSRKHNGK